MIDGCCEFLRLVTLNSLGLIPQLERRVMLFKNLEVEFLFNESDQNFTTNVHEYPNI